jgi:hypothetical protein
MLAYRPNHLLTVESAWMVSYALIAQLTQHPNGANTKTRGDVQLLGAEAAAPTEGHLVINFDAK